MQLAETREAEALALRLRGHHYAEIGEMMGVSHETARKAVLRAMAKVKTESAETAAEVREQEAARLDGILVRLAEIVERTPDESTALAVVDRLLRVQERRAKLLGLDLQRLEVTGAAGGPIQIATIQRIVVDAPGAQAKVIDVQPEPAGALPALTGSAPEAVPTAAEAAPAAVVEGC